jgi:hypothetical protein
MSPDEAPMTSIAVPRMQRAVCPDCEHFHRRAIRDKCECCDADCRANDRGRGEPVNGQRITRLPRRRPLCRRRGVARDR